MPLVAMLVAGCELSTEPAGPVADLRGVWTYSGTQAVPALDLDGTLTMAEQAGAQVEGTASWVEQDGLGNTALRGGSLAGTVIGVTDIDLEVALSETVRRHVGRISTNGDTLQGVWAEVGGGLSGTFIAVRQEM
jgi:hypothetical protein